MQNTRRTARRAFASLGAAAALVAGTLALAVGPAAAVGDCAISGASNGVIGAQQTLNVNDCGNYGSMTVAYANGNGQNVSLFQGAYGPNAQALWSPNSTGQANLQLGGVTYATVNITKASTATTLDAPNNAKVGQATKLTVTVASQALSSYSPTGQVVVKDVNGATLATMGLTQQGNGSSYAYYWWTPPAAGTYTFQATYSGDSSASGSTSPQDFTVATPNGNPISLSVPPTLTAGVPATLQANVYPSSVQGSVGFTVNGQPISASIPLQNGVAKFQWTPPAAGAITLGASYTTNQGGSGSTSQQVTVVAGPVTGDVITLTQPGFGTWAPNGTYTVAAGSSTTFTASTLSGSPVTLSETGACSVNGLTLVAGPNGTTCNLVAKSAGGNGYAASSYGYTVTVGIGQQTANVNPPISGRVNKGKAIVLEGPGQGDTNAGQNIVWSVKKSSKSVCKLGFPADGSVTVKLVKKGSCTVTGKAPGVPGQWAPYAIARTYTA